MGWFSDKEVVGQDGDNIGSKLERMSVMTEEQANILQASAELLGAQSSQDQSIQRGLSCQNVGSLEDPQLLEFFKMGTGRASTGFLVPSENVQGHFSSCDFDNRKYSNINTANLTEALMQGKKESLADGGGKKFNAGNKYEKLMDAFNKNNSPKI